MRTALLSALETTEDGRLRAFERLGGRSLLAWQADLAKDLGCVRILCLCERDSDPLDDVRREAEQAGMEFRRISDPIALIGQLSADQDLVVLADGLVADRAQAVAALDDRRGVLTFSDETGIAAGFERIDAEHAWAGILVGRAQIAERLAELPPDSDMVSALLRLALQAGTRLVPIDDDLLTTGDWLLVRQADALAAREAVLLDRSVEQAFWRAPGTALSRRLARRLAPDAIERGPAIALALGGLAMSGAIALAAYAEPVAALGAFLLGVLVLGTGEALAALGARLRGIGERPGRSRIRRALVDLALLAVLALPRNAPEPLERLFLPVLLLGLLRLAASLAPPQWRASWNDRTPLVLVLLLAGWFDALQPSLALLCLTALGFCLYSRRDLQITQA
ncbi:MAG: hypothetical protein ACO25F_07665 [Erythrobacter sp.]